MTQRIMKYKLFILPFLLIGMYGYSQDYDNERVALKNFLVRMYQNAPFEGVKVVSDYNNNYLLSVVLVKNSNAESTMNRIAQVKSQRQVSQYLNGVVGVESETVIKTSEKVKEEKTVEEVIDIIRERSIGFTKAMEVLTVLDASNDQKCYMFYRKVEEMRE